VFFDPIDLNFKVIRLRHSEVKQTLETEEASGSEVSSRILALESNLSPPLRHQILALRLLAICNQIEVPKCVFMDLLVLIILLDLFISKPVIEVHFVRGEVAAVLRPQTAHAELLTERLVLFVEGRLHACRIAFQFFGLGANRSLVLSEFIKQVFTIFFALTAALRR